VLISLNGLLVAGRCDLSFPLSQVHLIADLGYAPLGAAVSSTSAVDQSVPMEQDFTRHALTLEEIAARNALQAQKMAVQAVQARRKRVLERFQRCVKAVAANAAQPRKLATVADELREFATPEQKAMFLVWKWSGAVHHMTLDAYTRDSSVYTHWKQNPLGLSYNDFRLKVMQVRIRALCVRVSACVCLSVCLSVRGCKLGFVVGDAFFFIRVVVVWPRVSLPLIAFFFFFRPPEATRVDCTRLSQRQERPSSRSSREGSRVASAHVCVVLGVLLQRALVHGSHRGGDSRRLGSR